MNKMKKITAFLCAAILTVSFTGCGNKGAEQEAANNAEAVEMQELRQSDYRGGVKRTLALKDIVLDTMDTMKANNNIIRQSSPNSFWTTDGYQDFVSTFLDEYIIDETIWFNEEQTDWNTILSQFIANPKFGDGESLSATFERNEKDDYTIANVPLSFYLEGTSLYIEDGKLNIKDYSHDISGNSTYHILYDCDKDWCKAYAQMPIEELSEYVRKVTMGLYEYRRIDDNTFAIQTRRERLLIKLKPAEIDTPICNREIAEFYYSKLVIGSSRTTFDPVQFKPEIDLLTGEMIDENREYNDLRKQYTFVNDMGEFSFAYGEDDSMFFLASEDMTTDWVFEDKSLQQAICYKDGALVVTTYNKLSTNYERFVFAKSDVPNSEVDKLEMLVEINNLVGVLDKEKVEVSDEVIVDNAETTEALTETTTSAEPLVDTTDVTETVTEAEGSETSEIEPTSEPAPEAMPEVTGTE